MHARALESIGKTRPEFSSPHGSAAWFFCAMAYDSTDGRLRGRKLQAARLRIWSADPHCAMCRKLVAYPHGFELDHITALHKEGSTNDDDNMQVLCPPCHQVKTAQDCGYKERAKFDASGRVVW